MSNFNLYKPNKQLVKYQNSTKYWKVLNLDYLIERIKSIMLIKHKLYELDTLTILKGINIYSRQAFI